MLNLKRYTSFAWMLLILFISTLLFSPISHANESTANRLETPVFDLREQPWTSGESFRLDGYWNVYWSHFIKPEDIATAENEAIRFPVPGVWSENPYRFIETQQSLSIQKKQPQGEAVILPALGYATYHAKVLLPEDLKEAYLYVPDMPSAYKLWINGEIKAQNGETGYNQTTEEPDFQPRVVKITDHQGSLDLVIHISNFHYREGGIWFSLRLTGEEGQFALEQQPIIFAVFFAAILIAIGLYNFSLFASRTKEMTALYFGLLCLVVGVRRLAIDERVLYMFDWLSWASLQRLEHLCFYLTLPLFMGFFAALYRKHVPEWTTRVSWLLISPFVIICLAFTNRVYTELNVAFQVLVIISVSYAIVMYLKVVKEKGKHTKAFGASLFILALTVIHDVLKANGIISSDYNIAHFGVIAFVISQSIALQRNYLKSLDLVEAMSEQLKSHNDELLEMDEFKDEFLATTSHELRTPLQGIAGLAKVLSDSGESNFSADQKSKIDLIAQTTQRLSVLVNDILDFSSIKHGKLKLNIAHIDLNAIADLVISTMRPLLGGKPVELRAEISPNVRYILADEFRIQQVLINVMGNAVKYTEKGFIRISAYLLADKLIIKISDSGVGIPSEKRHALFRPFEQVHVEGHPSASGTGLGLSISKQLVELHGGTLDIQSQVGKGTEVIMSFPDDLISSGDQEEPTTQATQSKQITKTLEKPATLTSTEQTLLVPATPSEEHEDLSTAPVIFIVDDEPVNLELVSSLMAQQGYQHEVFPDGISVLARLNERIPDLILLDYMMPRMNGIEVCQIIRKQFDSYELPIMMLTARHQIADIVNALGAGANDYLIKPYHDKELIARVEGQLSVRKFWIASKENQKLKNEIERREALEEELSELNAKLLSVLDVSEELIILINEQLNIAYTNDKAVQTFTGKLNDESASLLGKPIQDFVLPELLSHIEKALSDKSSETSQIDLHDASEQKTWKASIKYINDFDQPYLALIITDSLSNNESDTIDAGSAIASLTLELSESRRKINEIEGALKHVLSGPDSLINEEKQEEVTESGAEESSDSETALSVIPPDTEEQDSASSHKELIVTLLRTSLNMWERYTNKGKVDLAEQSRCWRVYVDGTTVKTRTFDKYLSARTVPDRPRWRAVVRTANFVVANCELSDSDKADLMRLTQLVEDFYT